jgi:hypothetical protein
MRINDVEAWRRELLSTGVIVQDADTSVPRAEAEAQFNRYVELTDLVVGDEGPDAAAALIQSIQVRDDYGAYQSTQRALGRFPHAVYVAALLAELPALIMRQSEWAGELLCGLANAIGTPYEAAVVEFRRQIELCHEKSRAAIRAFVAQEECQGWLSGRRRGVLS